MNKRVYIIAVWAFFHAMFCSATFPVLAGTGPIRIIVNEFSQVEGGQILLGQIAQIQAKPFIKEILETIDLGKSPKPGKIKTLAKNKVLSQLRSSQAAPEEIQLVFPDKIYVKQACQELPKESVRTQVDHLLSDYFSGREYEVKRLQIQDTGFYPIGDLEMVVPSPIDVDKNGNFNFNLEVLVSRSREDVIRVRGQVAVYEIIACAAGNLEKGNPINEKDIVLVRKDIFRLRGQAARDAQSLEGQQLKINVRKNDPILMNWLEPLPLIQKGAVVTLVAEARHMKIVTSGIAREDGFMGQVVRVENLKSGKMVRGIVRQGAMVDVIY